MFIDSILYHTIPQSLCHLLKNVPNSQSTKTTQFDKLMPKGNFIPSGVGILIKQDMNNAEIKVIWESALTANRYELYYTEIALIFK